MNHQTQAYLNYYRRHKFGHHACFVERRTVGRLLKDQSTTDYLRDVYQARWEALDLYENELKLEELISG